MHSGLKYVDFVTVTGIEIHVYIYTVLSKKMDGI